MKTLLQNVAVIAVALLALGVNSASAQQPFTLLMVEDFDAVGVVPVGWAATVNTPAFPDPPNAVQEGWQILNSAGVTASYGGDPIYWNPLPPNNGGAFAVANDDQCNCDASNDVLTTPMFDMSQYDSLYFFFDLFNTEQWGSTGSFDYTVDGGNNWLTIALPVDPAVWQGLYLPLIGPFGDVQFSFVHNDGSTNGVDTWSGGIAVDSVLFVGFNTPCDDIINIASCNAPQTVSLSGTGVNDWNFTTACGWDVPGAEQLYSFTPTITGVHTLDVTSTTAVSWLDYMYKPAGLGCDTLNWICLDDVQDPGSYGMNLTAGIEYLILLDNEFVDLETQTFTIICPCSYVSQGNTPESETCGGDLNGGCNTEPGPAAYEPIACGGSVSGTLWANGGNRDTDWFQLVVTENTDVVLDFSAGMPINVFLIDNCTDLTTLAFETTQACATGNLTLAVAPGSYLVAVVPTGFESYPCGLGSANMYDLTVTYCEPVTNVDPCLTSADTWGDLNTAGAAPCNDGNGCTPTDPNFTTIGIYGSETYLLDNVQAGFDYVFDMCSGLGAGSWIPEIAIVAPDGTTVNAWNGEAATGSSLTFFDQCSLGWTATQSGTYSIIINQLGTAAGDAPNQVSCTTSYVVNNGNPTVLCGPNEASCLPCEAGDYTNDAEQDVCPGETALIALDGNQVSPTNYSIGFNSILGGTGGLNGGNPFTITGFNLGLFPFDMDEDINGTLSANSAPPLVGTWVLTFYAVDGGVPCDSTETMVVNFLDANDQACVTVGVNEASSEANVNVYPNPSNGAFTIELKGMDANAELVITDMSGRAVYNEQLIVTPDYKQDLNLNLAKGSYLLRVFSDSFSVIQKIEVN